MSNKSESENRAFWYLFKLFVLAISFLVFGMVLIGVGGCNIPPPPPPPPPVLPTIEAYRIETSTSVQLTVIYHNHLWNSQRDKSAVLDTPEKVKDYRKQVEFLLKQLDETEQRMKAYEQAVQTEQ